ncbi:MAG: ABC transporter permease [Actinomycetota bacterium]
MSTSSAGWRPVARKEFADHLLSMRFIILLAIMGLAGVVAVYSASGGIRGAAEDASDFPALFLKLFTLSLEDKQIPSFVALLGLLGPLVGIMFAFDAINGERSQGTLPRLLAQPIYRDDVINGKFVAGLSVIGVIVGSVVLVLAGFGMFRIGIVPSTKEIGRVLVWLVVSIFYIGFWLALATLFSVWLRRAATSALAAIAAWLVLTLFAGLLIGIVTDAFAPLPPQPTGEEVLRNAKLQQNLTRLTPSGLYQDATLVLLQPEVRSLGILFREQLDRAVPSQLSLDQSLLIVWPQLTALIAATLLCFAGAYVLFMRQEIRA